MAYTQYDDTKPVSTDTGPNVTDLTNKNLNALRDMVVMGAAQGFDYSVTVGTGTAEQPQYLFFKKSTTWIRVTPTWGTGTPAGTLGNVTGLKFEKSLNSGGAYDAILSADSAFSYDTNGNLQTASNASGMLTFVMYLLGKVKAAVTSLAAHIAATGTAVHGLGAMATQSPSAVAVTGGSVGGVVLDYTIARGKVINLGNMTGTVNLDWSTGDIFVGTVTGNLTLTESNRPGHATVGNLPGGSLTLCLTNPGAYTLAWPAAWKWPSGVAPTRTASGLDVYEAVCYDATLVHAAQAQKDSR